MNGLELQAQSPLWGLVYAGLMYVLGNGVWVNHLARTRRWAGWGMWLVAGILVIVCGALIENRLDASKMSVWQRLTAADPENHWIVLTLFALMSVPGAASVLLRQNALWTRLALLIPALVVFIPAGLRAGGMADAFGTALVVCALVLVWQVLLDQEPEKGKTA